MTTVEKQQPVEVIVPAIKPCYYCSRSCDGLPRVKDKKGRYAHKACMLALTKPDLNQLSTRQQRLRRPPPHDDFLAQLPDLTPSIYDTVAPCPTCGEKVHPRAVLCTNCATDLTTTAPTLETKPTSTKIKSSPFSHTLHWSLGVLTGAALAATLWTALAPQLALQASPIETFIGAAAGAILVILADLARTLAPH